MDITNPAYIEVDLNNLEYNYNIIKEKVNEFSEVMAIVKADAYGLGLESIVKELISLGVNKFGVEHVSEAIQIRKKFKYAYILVMGYTHVDSVESAIENDIVLSVFLKEQAKLFSNKAKYLNKRLSIHLKYEGGLNKIGFRPTRKSIDDIQEIYGMDKIFLEGIFADFPSAQDDEPYTRKAMDTFKDFIKELIDKGIHIPFKHVNMTMAIINFPEQRFNMVRIESMLYGISPCLKANDDILNVKSCLSLKAQVFDVKTIELVKKLIHKFNLEVKRKTKVATVTLGCFDAYSRELSNVREVLVKGKRCSVIGRIYMDQIMIDVTGLKVMR